MATYDCQQQPQGSVPGLISLIGYSRPHPCCLLSGVATWPKLPSTAGKPEPQPAALFPLWDLVSYFFRLWFGERNQRINDFFPQKPLNNSFWHVFAFLLAVWFWSSCGEQRTQSVAHRSRVCPSFPWPVLLLACMTWVSAVPAGPATHISTPPLEHLCYYGCASSLRWCISVPNQL